MQIKAKVIADSISNGNRVVTMELEYPRFIHGEFMTHRVFSRNAASSRAIKIEKMMEQVLTNPALPVHWGANQAGMKAEKKVKVTKAKCIETWNEAAYSAVKSAQALQALGLHKQVVNRVLEPFQIMRTIVTATEWDNFFTLRDHKDAQPEIAMLASKMKAAMEKSTPMEIRKGEWHAPYVERKRGEYGQMVYYSGNKVLSTTDALKVSASCCAQVSYNRKTDAGIEKAINIFTRLVDTRPIHASPFEHQACPQTSLHYKNTNFVGFGQYRSIIEN